MALRLVATSAPAARCPIAVDFCVTMALLPTTMTVLVVDMFFICLGVPAKSRGQRAIISGQRNWDGRVVIEGKFGPG